MDYENKLKIGTILPILLDTYTILFVYSSI